MVSGTIDFMKKFIRRYQFLHLLLRRLKVHFDPNKKGVYPRIVGAEVNSVKDVLYSPGWNICYGKNLAHNTLEEKFAEYIGTKYAVAVNTGGMAIQMSLRALGLRPGDEIIHQVDTCVANPFAILNAQITPIFADISLDTFMLSKENVESLISSDTKAIMPIHMWGNAENMDMITEIAQKHKLYVIEDGCLGLGAKWKNKMAGSMGTLSVFSFGCLKPIQTGEGGIIATNDESLAKELRTIRSYGDMTREYGVRDQKTLSWNGRISEILAAIATEQLLGYDKILNDLETNVKYFKSYLHSIKGIIVKDNPYKKAYTQLVLQIDERQLGISKQRLFNQLSQNGISVWHANFEPINCLQFFKNREWKSWIQKGNIEKVQSNYSDSFINAYHVYNHSGLGLNKQYFLTEKNTNSLIYNLEKHLRKTKS